MKTKIIVGCSSYYNGYWKGIFYPEDLPRAQWFDYYCRHFETYEINGTFYKFPTLKTFEGWFKKAPDNFLFSVKAPKTFTHIRKFIDCESELADFYTRCNDGLKHKLACILFQFPPSYRYSAENLELIISKLNLNFENVLEFRHQSWWIPEVWEALRKNRITFCSTSHPQLPETILAERPLIYVRLHGKEKMFYSSYSKAELAHLKKAITKNDNIEKVYVYFNNTASTAGILDALALKKAVTPE